VEAEPEVEESHPAAPLALSVCTGGVEGERIQETENMSEADNEQNRRIRDVESRINELENQVALLVGKLDATTAMLKAVAIGVGALVGLDLQSML
tara:strand:+ start:1433 stop:1717 length:285 start_codon:yes stop_codon:yes gene_type:complete